MTARPFARTVSRVVAGLAILAAAGCAPAASTSPGEAATASAEKAAKGGLFDDGAIHTIAVAYEEAAYDAMIETFTSTGEKVWISATVTIDGVAYEEVGIKLKGNSSLRGLEGGTAGPGGMGVGAGGTASADTPESLPWRIRLDKYVDGQNHLGETDIVVRANNFETSLNEAVALELIGMADLATQDATATRFTVNGSEEVLRLAVEMPDEAWYEETFAGEGLVYKAEAEGDYSYRGDDPEAYAAAFEIEAATMEEDWAPLIDFLEFLDTADDATFAADLDEWLDVAEFADYLAVQDLVANDDNIDGPGNNSYLQYDAEAGIFTVVTWDENLAFGGLGGGSGGFGFGGDRPAGEMSELPEMPGGEMPDGGTMPGRPDVGERPESTGGGLRGGNVLAERFRANADFSALVEERAAALREELYASGAAQEVLDRWADLLTDEAANLVDADTVATEASRIAAYFTS